MTTNEKPVTGTETAGQFKTLEEAHAELAKTRDALTAANSEAAERRRALKKFEDADAARQAEEQKRRDAELSEVDRLKKAAESEKAARTAAEQRAQKLELRQEIARGVKKLKAEFASDAAEDDANEKLLAAVKFEDGKLLGLDEALKVLQKERDYLFAKGGGNGARVPSIDATTRGRVDQSGVIVSDENEQEMKTRYGIR